MALSAHARPIPGAVATLGVSDRVAFLRKTYAHLGVTLVVWAALTAYLMRTEFSLKFTMWALGSGSRLNWLLVIGLFMVVGIVAEKLARSESSRGLQYVGLGLAAIGEAILLQPMLWLVIIKFGNPNDFIAGVEGGMGMGGRVIMEAALITVAIFVGLTATVFITRKDFSFMRGALSIGMFAVLGVIIASMIFGFHLGAIFSGAVILLMAGYILYQTSMIMRDFPPTAHVAAALMLFSTIATLFWYVLRLVMSLRSD